MEIEIRQLVKLNEERNFVADIHEDTDIKCLLEKLQIALAAVGLVTVNKYQAKLNQKLKKGDVVCIFPPIGGG